jgi:hypothetical protein
MAKLLPSSKSSIVKFSPIISKKSFGVSSNKTEDTPNKFNIGILKSVLKIDKKVIVIDKLLKDSLFLTKKSEENKKKQEEKKEFSDKEKKLEKKNLPKEKAGINLPSPPKMGFLDWIKNFITQTILGFFAVRLIKFLPKLLEILPTIINVSDFIISWGGKLLDGLITFVDWGYKAIDGTKETLKKFGGDGLESNFDKFIGAVGNIIDIAIIAAIATADSGSFGKDNKPSVNKRGFDVKGNRVNRSVQNRYAQRYGRNQFVDRFGKKNLQNLYGGARRGMFQKGARSAFMGLAGKGGAKAILGTVRPLLKRLPIIGALIDFGLSVALGENPGRAAFKAIGAALLGSLGAAVGSVVPVAGTFLGGLLGGFAGDAIGGALYDMFFGNKKPKTGKVAKAAGGGMPSTRGGKLVGGPPKRTIKKKKTPRTLSATRPKLKPGSAIGGEKKIKELYPEPKDKTKMSPFEFLKKSYNRLTKLKELGGVASLGIKSVMGDRLNYIDFKSAATGINNWINKTMTPETLAYAGGGEVNVQQVISGEDYSDVIAKSLQHSVAPESEKIIQDLMKQLMLKKTEQEIKEKEPTGEPTTPEGIPLGEGETASGRALMSGLVQRGFTKEEAAAIVGNLWAESGFRTTATNPTSGAFGLMQWLGGRKSRLYSYAAEQGKQVTDVNLQLDYIKWELKGGNAYETAQFQKAMAYGSGVADKTRGFAQEVERASARELSSSMSKRVGAAESVYGGRMVAGENPISNVNLKGGSGKFVQGNSGNSGGIHFHIGPGTQPGQVDTRYNSDARISASKVIKHFLGKKSLYDGRRDTSYTSGSGAEVMAAQKAHSASGSQGGIDIQVGGGYDPGAKVQFPFAVSNMAYRPGGFGVSAKINGLNAFVAHGRYDENGKIAKQERGINLYAFHGMNKVMSKDGLLKYHKGEFISVTDADSFRLVGNILMDINGIENKSQLIARAPSIIEKLKSISGYTDYEQEQSQIVFVPMQSESSEFLPLGSKTSIPSYYPPSIDSMGDQMSDSLMYG